MPNAWNTFLFYSVLKNQDDHQLITQLHETYLNWIYLNYANELEKSHYLTCTTHQSLRLCSSSYCMAEPLRDCESTKLNMHDGNNIKTPICAVYKRYMRPFDNIYASAASLIDYMHFYEIHYMQCYAYLIALHRTTHTVLYECWYTCMFVYIFLINPVYNTFIKNKKIIVHVYIL